jgi:hypothetical protein
LYFAFIISYAIKLLLTNLNAHDLTSIEIVEIDHFLILVLALANSLYFTRLYVVKF